MKLRAAFGALLGAVLLFIIFMPRHAAQSQVWTFGCRVITQSGALPAKCPQPGQTAASIPSPTPTPSTAFVAQNPTFIGGSGAVSSLSYTFPKPAASPGASSDNYLAVYLATGNSSLTVNPPAGWSVATDYNGVVCKAIGTAGQQGFYLFIHKVVAGDTAGPYTFSYATGVDQTGIVGLEIDNASRVHPIDACATSYSGSIAANAPFTTPTITATVVNDLPLYGLAPSTTGLTLTAGTGWTGASFSQSTTLYMTIGTEQHPPLIAIGGTSNTSNYNNSGSIVFNPIVGNAWAPPNAVFPTPTPTVIAGNGCQNPPGSFTNGVDWPTTFKPGNCSSVFNVPLPSGVKYNPNDAAFVNNIIGTKNPDIIIEGPGTQDFSRPIYFASNSDPLVTINCTTYCNTTDNGGYPAQIHIPAFARQAGGGDSHMGVIQPDASGNPGKGNEIDFWGASVPSTCSKSATGTCWHTGDTLTTRSAMNCGSLITTLGFVAGVGATSGSQCLSLGQFTYAELASGTAQHAIIYNLQCQANGNVYPVQISAPTAVCTDSPEPHLGQLLWSDYSCSNVQLLSISNPEKTILCSLNVYGAYFLDNGSGANTNYGTGMPGFGGGGIGNDEDAYASGQAQSKFAGLKTNFGFGSHLNSSYNSNFPWFTYSDGHGGALWNPLPGGWTAHIHFLCPPPAPPSTTWVQC